MATQTLNITMVDDDGLETEVAVPALWQICHYCQGAGKSSSHLGAFSRDEMDEQGPEFLEDYLAGMYDKSCDNCSGSGKVLVIDEVACRTPEQKAALKYANDVLEQINECNAITRAEMAAGA